MCSDWKTRNAQQPGGGVFTNWCKFPGQICTANGTLLRLDMRGFNLQCPFPATDMAVFTSLTTLNLGRNPNMTVSTTLTTLDPGCIPNLAMFTSLTIHNLGRNPDMTVGASHTPAGCRLSAGSTGGHSSSCRARGSHWLQGSGCLSPSPPPSQ